MIPREILFSRLIEVREFDHCGAEYLEFQFELPDNTCKYPLVWGSGNDFDQSTNYELNDAPWQPPAPPPQREPTETEKAMQQMYAREILDRPRFRFDNGMFGGK